MVDLMKRLASAKAMREAIVNQTNQLIQEGFRLDGEVRLLERMIQDESKSEPDKDKVD